MNYTYYYIAFFLGILISFEAIALYSIQKFEKVKEFKFFILAMICYGILVPCFLYKNLKYKNIGMINFFWNIFSTIIGFTIGILLFSERVNNLQWIGISLSLLGIGLVILNDYQK
jgi:multidrug transporter EmrE-like cation transporter